jgi:PAS domain S-box-containing protein
VEATHTSPQTDTATAPSALFAGPGEMRELCRALDWGRTPLGPVEGWSLSLRTISRTMLGSRNPMFLFWGPDLVQLYNDAYRPSLGQAGRHPRGLGARGMDFWTDIWEAIGPQIEQVMTTGEPTWHEDQYLPIERDGGLQDVWWTYSYSPAYDDDGSIGGTLVICQETTSRMLADREREHLLAELALERGRLAEVFRQSPSFLAVLTGPDNVFEAVNAAYQQLVGHGRELAGRPLFEALPETRGQGFDAYLARVRETGEPLVFRDLPARLERTPGAPLEERFLDVTYLPLVEADGSRRAVVAHGTDVTEQVLARRAIEAAREEAEAANRAKSQFLATMSHELRTPLNAIGGYAELLEMGVRGEVTEEQREDLRRIQASQRHLLGLINEVLNYAKLEAGTVHYDLEDVPAAVAVAAAETLVAPQARARGLALRVGTCTEELTLRADPEKLRQILVNLLSNAVKFTPSGGRIDVTCAGVEGGVALRVRDTGIGIPPERLESIFDPFVQVRSDLTRPHEGTGLGLAISRSLARGMGGDLVVESAPGRGAAFELTLPAAPSGA